MFSDGGESEIFHVIGGFGPAQKKISVLLMTIGMFGAWQVFSVTFQAPEVDYHCVLPQRINYTSGDNSVTADQCHVRNSNGSLISCEEWEYDTTFYGRTIVSEWDLVCDREWLISLAKSIYMVGFMASMIVFGQMSDCVGRYPTLLVCYVITLAFGLLGAFSRSYNTFLVTRFFMAFGRSGLATTGFVLFMEIIGPEYRTLMGIVNQLGSVVGCLFLPVLAWYFRPWSSLQLVITLPFVPLACLYWIFPESPRWLRARGKISKLKDVLGRISKSNGRFSEFKIAKFMTFIESGNFEKKRETFADLVRSPRMRTRFVCTAYLWAVTAFLYYSLAYNTNDLSGNPYENFFLSFAVEIPSHLTVYCGIRTAGRRLSLLIGLSATATSYVLLLMTGDPSLRMVLVSALLGRFFVSGIFALLYLYTIELFPTVVRNTAVASCSTFARIGSITAPFVRELGHRSNRYVPNALSATLAISGVFLALRLPETKDRKIPDTLDEGENFASDIHSSTSYKLLSDLQD